MNLDFNNPFLQQKITQQAEQQFKPIYQNDFIARNEGAKIITEVLKQPDNNNNPVNKKGGTDNE